MEHYVEVKIDQMIKNQCKKDAAFAQEYKRTRPLVEVQQAIVSARIEKGLNQQQLAKLVGISPSDLSKIERGDKNTTVQTLYKIADALNKNLKISFN